MIGDRFGKLVVLGEADRAGHHRMWECECDCGNRAIVRGSDLRRRTRSCGCIGGRPRKEDGIDRGYGRSHSNVRRKRGPASDYVCSDCPELSDQWSYVGGCSEEKIGQEGFPYCEHVSHYQPRCRSCHVRLDRGDPVSVRRLRAAFLTHV